MDKQNNLKMMLQNAEHPITVLLGGDKIKEQMEAIESIASGVDTILVAGALVAFARGFIRNHERDDENKPS